MKNRGFVFLLYVDRKIISQLLPKLRTIYGVMGQSQNIILKGSPFPIDPYWLKER